MMPSIRSAWTPSRPSGAQSGASGGNCEAWRQAAGSHGDSRAGQRAISASRAGCGCVQSADRRWPVSASTWKRTRPLLHRRASRSARVGGITPSSCQARRRCWHSCGGVSAAARPSGQQASAGSTVPGRGSGSASPGARGRLSMVSSSSGKAVMAPYCPGSGVPSGRPTQTPTV